MEASLSDVHTYCTLKIAMIKYRPKTWDSTLTMESAGGSRTALKFILGTLLSVDPNDTEHTRLIANPTLDNKIRSFFEGVEHYFSFLLEGWVGSLLVSSSSLVQTSRAYPGPSCTLGIKSLVLQ